MNKDEQTGFHKGVVDTLLKERQEMVKIIQIVDSLLKAHIEALKKLGVDISKPPKEDNTPLEKKL